MLGYQSKNEEGNLRKFGLNPISNSVCALETICPARKLKIKFGT
jgi:hypothetical protein